MSHTRRFDNDLKAVTAARRFTAEVLAALAPDVLATAELLSAELSSNCVRHTDSPFEITIDDLAGEVRVAATDWGAGEPVMRPPDPTAISGRGLAIIDALAASWGVERLRVPRPGKVVWFTLLRNLGACRRPRRLRRPAAADRGLDALPVPSRRSAGFDRSTASSACAASSR